MPGVSGGHSKVTLGFIGLVVVFFVYISYQAKISKPNISSQAQVTAEQSLRAAKPGDLIVFPDKSGNPDYFTTMIIFVDASQSDGSEIRVHQIFGSDLGGGTSSRFVKDMARAGAKVISYGTPEYGVASSKCIRYFGPIQN